MAVSRSSTEHVDASGGNGSTSVTVPSDCKGVIVQWSYFDAASSSIALTLDGQTVPHVASKIDNSPTDTNGVGTAFLDLVTAGITAGSKTFAWTYSAGGARSEGGKIIVAWLLADNDLIAVRDADIDADTGTSAISTVTIDSVSGDYCHCLAESFDTPEPLVDGSNYYGPTILNSDNYELAVKTASGASTSFTTGSSQYPSITAISLYDYSAEPTPVFVQAAGGNGGSATSCVQAFSSDVQAGDTLIMLGSWGSVGINATGVTDTMGNVWTEHPSGENDGDGGHNQALACWTATAISNGPCTVTMALDGSVGSRRWLVYAARNVGAIEDYDMSAAPYTMSGASGDLGMSVTPTTDGAFIFAGTTCDSAAGTFTDLGDLDFQHQASNPAIGASSYVQGTASSATLTWQYSSSNQDFLGFMLAFAPSTPPTGDADNLIFPFRMIA